MKMKKSTCDPLNFSLDLSIFRILLIYRSLRKLIVVRFLFESIRICHSSNRNYFKQSMHFFINLFNVQIQKKGKEHNFHSVCLMNDEIRIFPLLLIRLYIFREEKQMVRLLWTQNGRASTGNPQKFITRSAKNKKKKETTSKRLTNQN